MPLNLFNPLLTSIDLLSGTRWSPFANLVVDDLPHDDDGDDNMMKCMYDVHCTYVWEVLSPVKNVFNATEVSYWFSNMSLPKVLLPKNKIFGPKTAIFTPKISILG